jgi:predicted metal-dependent hydrolase
MRPRHKAAIRRGRDLSIRWQGREILCQTRYSPNRRTLQISVRSGGEVVIAAPSSQNEQALLAFAASKAAWIASKLELVRTLPDRTQEIDLVSGRLLYYLGHEYRLQIIENAHRKRPAVTLDQAAGTIFLTGGTSDPEALRRALTAWYRRQADALIPARVGELAEQLRLAPRLVRVKKQKRRWGSCTATGHILLNWRGIMAPPSVLDYIIVHELGHLRVMNHSTRFWDVVRTAMPDYRERRRWLRDNGSRLSL